MGNQNITRIMGTLKLNSALSYGALCGAAFWALTQSYSDGTEDYWSCSNVAFALITLHAMFGFWKYGRSSSSTRKPKFFKPLSFFANLYTIPLLCVDMYLFNYFTFEIAYLHLIYPVISIFSLVQKRKPSFKSMDFINFLSLTSLSFISAMSKNYFGLIAAVLHATAHYVLSQNSRTSKNFGIASKDGQNYVMAAFVYFALRALVLAETKWVRGGVSCGMFSLLGS